MNPRQNSSHSLFKHLGVETLTVPLLELERLPFFHALHATFLHCAMAPGRSSTSPSYAIWGGVAANILLMLARRTRVHFCCHDVELFCTVDSRIIHKQDLLDAIESRLLHEYNAPLALAGRSIIESKRGMLVVEFQGQRVSLGDGDLFLNNVLLTVDANASLAVLHAPTGTFEPTFRGDSSLLIKDASSLQTLSHVARRIYRNVSKAIRFERVAGLLPTKAGLSVLSSLLDTYDALLLSALPDGRISSELDVSAKEWLATNQILSSAVGTIWLCKKVLSESAKRLAGLYGIACNDRARFERLVVGGSSRHPPLLNHPLMEMLSTRIVDRRNRVALLADPKTMDTYHADFVAYQRLGGEKLCHRYSLPADLDPPAAIYRK